MFKTLAQKSALHTESLTEAKIVELTHAEVALVAGGGKEVQN